MPTAAPADLHFVFAVTSDNAKHRISDAADNKTATEEWYAFDDRRVKDRTPQFIDGKLVKFFAVRAADDPDWPADAPVKAVQALTLHPSDFLNKSGRPLAAVREYATSMGIVGTAGGWLRRESTGQPVCQGWASFVHAHFNAMVANVTLMEAVATYKRRSTHKLTDDQALLLAALKPHGRHGLTSMALGGEMQRLARQQDPASRRWLDNYDAVRVGKQLAAKGLVIERGVPYGPKRYVLTGAGCEVAS
jgi:hypothetical protein